MKSSYMHRQGKCMQHSAISKQLFTRVFSVYLVTAVIITSFQITDEYNHTEESINHEILNIYETFKLAISADLWTYDIDSLNSIVQGMIKLDLVNGIEILDTDGEIILSMGIASQQENQSRNQVLSSASGKHSYKMDQYIEKTKQRLLLGTLIIYSKYENIFNRVKYGILLIVISALLKTSCLWLIFSFFIKKYLASPLLRFSEQVNQVNFDNLSEQKIDIKSMDVNELSFLQDNFNHLLSKLSDASTRLDQLNLDLEDKVEQRTSELNNSIKDLTESKKMNALSILVNGMAHEINTPIGVALTGNSHLLTNLQKAKDKFDDNTLSKQDLMNFFDTALKSSSLVDECARKVGNLVSRFKKVSGEVNNKSEVVVQEVVETILAVYRHQLEKNNVNIRTFVEIKTPIIMDPSVIPQILSTFIENSLAHAFQGLDRGEIQCTFYVADSVLKIRYFDNGVGLRELEAERIFDPFYTTNRGLHTGLGLNIIYNLVVTGLGGKISCTSKTGLGLNVDLPIKPSSD